MYIQDRFRESRTAALHAFMRAHALATVVIAAPQLEAFLMPLELVSDGALGVLRGHVVRKNHLSTAPRDSEVLAIFQGANAYISPRWYVNGQKSGRVAPSWNFSTVHASGRLRLIDDGNWVHAHLAALADAQELGRVDPWKLSDAPREFVDDLVQRLIGIEIQITKLEGKQFLSQTRTPADRENIVKHLRAESRASASDVALDIETMNSQSNDPST